MNNLKELIERETGNRFSRKGFICCPFHNEKTGSLSVKFNSDKNKDTFKCFGCGESGDSIDFIMKYRNMDYLEAAEYLGIKVDKKKKENEDKLKVAIDKKLKNLDGNNKLLGIFSYVDSKNNIVYWKIKYKDLDTGKKNLTYFSLDESGNIKNNRGTDFEYPYNLYKAVKTIQNNGTIMILEGEKDVNTIENLRIPNLTAISIKNVKDLKFLYGTKIIVCGDTGLAGEKYIEEIKENLFEKSKSFKILKPRGLEKLGDNKDITDLFEETAFSKEDFKKCINRTLDLKDKNELQQDWKGIKKTVFKRDKDGFMIENTIYLSNFNIVSAEKIKFIDEDREGLKVIFKSSMGEIIERTGDINSFDDVKTFKAFLNSMDLTFLGKGDDLNLLKIWINNYFISDEIEVYTGVKTIKKDNELIYITPTGSLTGDNKILKDVVTDDNRDIDILEIGNITKEEFEVLFENIFDFADREKTFSIIGTIVNNLFVYQAEETNVKLNHLLIVGESGSGKSTILEKVISAILNVAENEIKSIGLITKFALVKHLNSGNTVALFDEFKPSRMDKHQITNISEMLRNSYDRTTVTRGNKDLKVREFTLNRPIVIVGEESYPAQEKALIERSNIVYLSKSERNKLHTEKMEWIKKNQIIIKKFGKALLHIALKTPTSDYKLERDSIRQNVLGLENRPLETATNCIYGLNVINKLSKELNSIKFINDLYTPVVKNISSEILSDNGDTYSVVEQMLIKFNELIVDNRIRNVADIVFNDSEDFIYMRTTELINQLNEYIKATDSDFIGLSIKDFKKQAKKSGYIVGSIAKWVNGKTTRLDTYDIKKLEALNLESIITDDFNNIGGYEVIEDKKNNLKVIKPRRN